MRRLSEADLIRVWEIGIEQHPLDRALTFLAAALPEMPQSDMHHLSIGRRDTLLLQLYEQTFGPQLEGYATCPHCQEQVEFTLSVAEILSAAPAFDTPGGITGEVTGEVEVGGYRFTLRPPNSLDLAAVLRLEDASGAGRLLVERCIVAVSQDEIIHEGAIAEALTLSDQNVAQLVAQLATLDPQAEIELELSCTRCLQRWSLLLDIVTFLWMDLCRYVKGLLYEVHLLALAYGWSEADILAMSVARRQLYLKMVG